MKNTIRFIFLIILTSAFAMSMADAQWVLTNGPKDATVLSFAVSGTNLFAATGGIFVTSDDGESWREIDSGITRKFVNSLAVIGSNIFAGSDEDIYLSTNNGMSWTSIYHDINLTVRCLAVSRNALFASTGLGILATSDDGHEWSTIEITSYALAVDGPYLFSGVYRSNLDGSNQITMGIIGSNFLVNGNDILAATSAGEGIFISTDSGVEWSPVNNGLIGDSIVAMIATNGDLFVGTLGLTPPSEGVLLSTNQGASWNPVNTGLTDFYITALAVYNGYMFAGNQILSGSNGGIWRRPLSDFGISSVTPTTGNARSISVFPNPTLGRVTILAATGVVTVTNALGETVQHAMSPHSPELTLDLSKLPVGTYFVYMNTASGPVVQKILKE